MSDVKKLGKTIQNRFDDHVNQLMNGGTWFSDEVDAMFAEVFERNEPIRDLIYEAVAVRELQTPQTPIMGDPLDTTLLAHEMLAMSRQIPEPNPSTIRLVGAHYKAHCHGPEGNVPSSEDVARGVQDIFSANGIVAELAPLTEVIESIRQHEQATGKQLNAEKHICDLGITGSIAPSTLADALPPRPEKNPLLDVTPIEPESPSRPKR